MSARDANLLIYCNETIGMHLLELPFLYDLWSGIYLPAVARAIRDIIGNAHGIHVLDLGCGTGRIKSHFPQADFTGIDVNRRYIAYAQKKSRGRFIVGDVLDLSRFLDRAGFDYILMNGLLHHVDSGRAMVLMNIVHGCVKPEGRVIVVDHVAAPGLGLINRLLLSCDRGAFIRSEAGYAELFKAFRVCSHDRVAIRLGPVNLCSSLTMYVLQQP